MPLSTVQRWSELEADNPPRYGVTAGPLTRELPSVQNVMCKRSGGSISVELEKPLLRYDPATGRYADMDDSPDMGGQ